MDSKEYFATNATEAPVDVDPGSAALTEYVRDRQISLAEALDKYDLIEAVHDPVNGSYVVVADRGEIALRDPGLPLDLAFAEMGYASPSPWTNWTREEWNPKLRDKQGLREYYRMKRADGIVRGALRMLKTPIQAGRWFIEPASDSERDKKIAAFVSKNLFEDLNVTWSKILDDALLCCEYGFMPFEKVFGFNDQGQVVLKKLAPRHPLDIQEWVYDREGGPNGVIMEPIFPSQPPEARFIPIAKMVVVSLEAEAGDLNGISVLRSAYKHYYYKDNLYKIDAIQKERHGIGVPVIKLPPGYKKEDKIIAEQLGRNLRTNDRAHIVLPPNWEVLFAKLEGNPVDCMKSIEHHNQMIQANVLTPFLTDSNVDPKSTDMFMKSTRYIGNTICDVFNKYVIPQLVNFNFYLGSDRSYPQLRVRRVGEWEDLRTMSFTIRNLVGAGVIIPDDTLEAFTRREIDLPAADPETARVISTPQAPGQTPTGAGSDAVGPGGEPNKPTPPKPAPAGPPRQSTVKNNAGLSSTGRDTSGG